MINIFGFLCYKVEPNQEFHGLVCEGANVLPTKFVEDAFRDGYGRLLTYCSYLIYINTFLC